MVFDAIVLAGGSGARFGGRDKASIGIDGATLLERALRATSRARTVVVVGPQRPVDRDVVWTVEDPPGAGPAAAIGAGLSCVDSDSVVVVAVDLPLLSRAHIDRLVTSLNGHDGACFADTGGRTQYLAAVYRTETLRRASARDLRGSSVRELLAELDLVTVVDAEAAMDCDTPEDLRRLRDYFSSY